MSTLTAPTLLKQFQVWGHFYELQMAENLERLRSHLELFPVDWDAPQAIESPADLVVVMMNPGSSRPLSDARASNGFVSTRPDNTQYQILRLMLQAQTQGRRWQHARVLNLSDLRTPKSAELLAKLKQYGADDRHSIFSPSRRIELTKALGPSKTPVLCAWGLSPHLQPWAVQALAAVGQHPRLGLSTLPTAYRHPLPQRADFQKAWLAQVVAQVVDLN